MRTPPAAVMLLWSLLTLGASPAAGQSVTYEYHPAPAHNPLKGLVPYVSQGMNSDGSEKFPHSMEFNYLPLSDLVTGPGKYDWEPLETLLNSIAGRRHQAVFRVWMVYPGHTEGIPQYLVDEGLKVTEWLNTNTAPFPAKKVRTPNYEDPRLRECLRDFVAALGERYDGDPRIGYITAGLLGTWGEWHEYPRDELMASKAAQAEVLHSFDSAFETTPILLRYPAGADNYNYAPNVEYDLGYHDDSFAWATLDTDREEDSWFFEPALKLANATTKWQQQPIGGEIRPEVWGRIFDEQVGIPQAQDFATCVQRTHVTWLMDSGMFTKRGNDFRRTNAEKQVQRMGYELFVARGRFTLSADRRRLQVEVTMENRGVAPFYYRWPVELELTDARQGLITQTITDWDLRTVLPDQPQTFAAELQFESPLPAEGGELRMRVVNPLPNGLPLLFANTADIMHEDGRLTLTTLR